ncbi:hypothetical protein EW026_g1701 [Hermanssonia centrifuga]|uniref:Uncharacterized protein n=1 Tax=Hermanssonia centrifuga TaxID=98765 RepID=A0A4S4KQK9_9APHY|nr:hypothetical protein EW026_g1701 [Hermanssonia centrifuga]
MSRTDEIRGKLFGGTDKGGLNDPHISRSSSDVPLSIHIPKPDAPTQPNPPPKSRAENKTESSPKSDQDQRPFRQRLVDQVGTEYHGAERHRLVQDDKRELHWKRWGPYLSDRQWGIRGNHGEDVKELYYYLDSTPTHSYMKFLYKYPQKRYPYEELVRENMNRGRDVPEFEILDTDVFDDDRYWDVFVEYAKDEQSPENVYVRITSYNRGPDPATLHVLPQLWFPNTWSWNHDHPPKPTMYASGEGVITAKHQTLGKFNLYCLPSPPPVNSEGEEVESAVDSVLPDLLFTENNTNFRRLYGGQNETPYVKDAFHDHIIPSHRPPSTDKEDQYFTSHIHSNTSQHKTMPSGANETETPPSEQEEGPRTPFPHDPSFVNPEKKGTKSGAHYIFRDVPPRGGCAVVRLKLTPLKPSEDPSIEDEGIFDDAVEERREEANEFYSGLVMGPISDDFKQIMRQAMGGMLWTKQYYQFVQKTWIEGDPAQPPPPPDRKYIRNREWKHLYINDILSMPDKWEYPFFAAWDTAFHCIPLAVVDPAFAKKQLDLLTREWYMKPDGQIPAYEWNFGDVNPPVHAWATFRVFKIERKLYGVEDVPFLERVFQKLLLNFTWWVNRKDQGGNNVFEGGFLGLDNIGVFNRSEPLPTGGNLRQADGTAWMAFYCLNMLNIALELAKHNTVYEDIASKFFEHFIFIADAMTYKEGDNELSLWNEEDGMYYDAIQFGPGDSMQLPVRSLVGLIPLYATLVLEPAVINRLPGFKKRMEWFIENRPEISERNMANMKVKGRGERRLLALASKERLEKILEKMLDEDEFFSDHGIRSLSKKHKEHPWGMDVNGEHYEVNYWPGDSMSGMFGGNSNWRGPIWLAVNFLLIESLQRFYQYYGDEVQVECPTGSGDYMNLANVAEEIQHRIIHIFGRDRDGKRATNGGNVKLDRDPHFRDYVLFYEYFHADDGRGLGASHQTGWSGLVAYHILQSGASCRLPKTPKTPRSVVNHYFDETIEAQSEYGGDAESVFSAFSAADFNTLGDISPDAL